MMGQTERLDEEFVAKLKRYRLNRDEHKRICGLIGREPQGVEWALFSALWSEHCSYKSSRVHLKNLYNSSPRVLQAFGENAGVVDLGDGERVAFKIESHNHPSYIEPYQGAATGVGGILRDIFTMGARPIASANYLCFGRPDADRMEKLVDGVVRGIGGYGNAVGVPTVTGQTEFHETYDRNILVNAMAVGLFRPGEKVFLSKAKGPGNLVVYAGAKTGRDGVHGASMASESFGKDSAAKRPTVQIGDPFFEKLLIESCLEVMAEDLVVAIQDMGAAGLTSSSFEMASKGGVGFIMHLDRVPLRDSTLTPEDILLSESQERMLMVVEPKKLERVQQVFARWGLEAVAIGEVIPERKMKLYWQGDLLTEIDPDLLTEHAPKYERPFEKWSPRARVPQAQVAVSIEATAAERELERVIKSPQGCSREFIYRQYDAHVGASTVADCEDSVGVLRLKDSGRGLGVVLGCRPQVMRQDARDGGFDAIAYPALELAAKGFEPLAVTDCLNFGNPERVEVMSSFVAALDGMNELCRALETPIISGNVSFYNETEGRNITSTPSTGLVGLRPEVLRVPKSAFTKAGREVFLLRLPQLMSGGAYRELCGQEPACAGQLVARPLVGFLRALTQVARDERITATRVVGKFGLGYALAKMLSKHRVGVRVGRGGFEAARHTLAAGALFHEVFYEVIVETSATPSELRSLVMRQLAAHSPVDLFEMVHLGQTEGSALVIEGLLNVEAAKLEAWAREGWSKAFSNLTLPQSYGEA